MTKVFLSWSGQAARDLADSFKEAIEFQFHTECFISSEGIRAGEEWLSKLSQGLDECAFAIIFLTPESWGSGWLQFEAGVLWGRHRDEAHRICPLLIGVDRAHIPDCLTGSTSVRRS